MIYSTAELGLLCASTYIWYVVCRPLQNPPSPKLQDFNISRMLWQLWRHFSCSLHRRLEKIMQSTILQQRNVTHPKHPFSPLICDTFSKKEKVWNYANLSEPVLSTETVRGQLLSDNHKGREENTASPAISAQSTWWKGHGVAKEKTLSCFVVLLVKISFIYAHYTWLHSVLIIRPFDSRVKNFPLNNIKGSNTLFLWPL